MIGGPFFFDGKRLANGSRCLPSIVKTALHSLLKIALPRRSTYAACKGPARHIICGGCSTNQKSSARHALECKKAVYQENKENSVKRLFRNNGNEDRGDILIHGFLVDVRIIDVDAKINQSRDPTKVFAAHEREKKKCIEACLTQRL
jgi:hypothetical protein